MAEPLLSRDRLATLVVWAAALVALVPLVLIVGFILSKGWHYFSLNFFTQTMQAIGPLDKTADGGAKNAIFGTLEQVTIATLISLPLGILTGLFLSERPGRVSKVVRFFVDAMSGVPSIVAGLFIFAIYIIQFHRSFSGMAAGMALSVLMLPTVARTSEEMLRLVPGGLREASLALGAPEWKTVIHVVLPAACTGLVTAMVLGIARIAGETAPLLMTAFGNSAVNVNPLKGAQSALPLFVYQQIRQPQENQVAVAWTGALVLVLLVLALFAFARFLAARSRKENFR